MKRRRAGGRRSQPGNIWKSLFRCGERSCFISILFPRRLQGAPASTPNSARYRSRRNPGVWLPSCASALLHGFAQSARQFGRLQALGDVARVGCDARPTQIGIREIGLARQQHAGQAVSGYQDVAADLAEGLQVGSGAIIEFARRKLLHRGNRILTRTLFQESMTCSVLTMPSLYPHDGWDKRCRLTHSVGSPAALRRYNNRY